MAVVVKVSTEQLYTKVVSISDSIKVIQQEIANFNGLQQELAKKYWGGDAADYNYLEYSDLTKDMGPVLYGMMNKVNNLNEIAITYDKVEGYNKHAEAGQLPEDFLD